MLYDDYSELQPGALVELADLLEKYCSSSPIDLNQSKSGTGGSTYGISLSRLASWWKTVTARRPDTSGSSRPPGLPRHGRLPPEAPPGTLPGVCPTIPQTPNPSHDFVLLCVPFSQRAIKLYQPEVCRINSDQEFFQVLRHYYSSYRGPKPWDRLRKVRAIDFIEVSK